MLALVTSGRFSLSFGFGIIYWMDLAILSLVSLYNPFVWNSSRWQNLRPYIFYQWLFQSQGRVFQQFDIFLKFSMNHLFTREQFWILYVLYQSSSISGRRIKIGVHFAQRWLHSLIIAVNYSLCYFLDVVFNVMFTNSSLRFFFILILTSVSLLNYLANEFKLTLEIFNSKIVISERKGKAMFPFDFGFDLSFISSIRFSLNLFIDLTRNYFGRHILFHFQIWLYFGTGLFIIVNAVRKVCFYVIYEVKEWLQIINVFHRW